MRQVPKRTSIRDVGLQRYLDDTATSHNGKNHADFDRYLNEPDEFGQTIGPARIAKAFGVSRYTVYKWMKIYKEETQQ